jgi:hypothetical protein
MNQSIQNYLNNFKAGKYESADKATQCDAGWYDWFCKTSSLKNKTYSLTKKLEQLVLSDKINIYQDYVFFKNNCGYKLYDDFRICDLETGEVKYTVTPRDEDGMARVWGIDNDFDAPLVKGNWKDVKSFFGV